TAAPPSLGEVARRVPGVMSQPAGAGQTAILVRGIGLVGDTTTAVYFADVPIAGPSGTGSDGARTSSDIALIDVAGISVARNARGTEHGVGALAGEIAVSPTAARIGVSEASASLAAGLQEGGAPSLAASGMGNLPLGPSAALRLVGYAQHSGGYVDNVRTAQRNVNASTTRGLRAALAWEPDALTTTDTLVIWQERRIGDSSVWSRDLGAYRTDRYFSAPTRHDFGLARLRVDRALGAVTLTSVSAAYLWNIDRRYDRTRVTQLQATDPEGCMRYFALETTACDTAQAETFESYVLGLTPTLLHVPIRSQRQIQEVRLHAERSTGLSWVLGAVIDRRHEALRSALSSVSLPDLTPQTYFGVRSLAVTRAQKAAFANASYRDSAGLRLAAGLRIESYSLVSQGDVEVPNVISGSIDSWPRTVRRSHGWQGSVHADVPIADHLDLHTQLSRTDRPGGVNTAPALVTGHFTYDGDTLWGIETGLRWSLDQRLDLSLTAFLNDWRDMQFRAFSDNRSFAYLVNIGNAALQGAEASARLHAGRLRAGLDVSYIDARLNRVTDAAALAGDARADDRLPFVPSLRANARVSRRFVLGDTRSLRLAAEWEVQSGFESTFRRDDPNRARTRAHQLANLDLVYASPLGELALSVKNLFDSTAILRMVSNGYGADQTLSAGPREWVLSLSRPF
ncbi:TonB-dependent receptor, partial [Novosphingobium sp. 1949]